MSTRNISRKYHDHVFLFKIIHGEVSSENLRLTLAFSVPQPGLRIPSIFHVHDSRNLSPIKQALTQQNVRGLDIYIFCPHVLYLTLYPLFEFLQEVLLLVCYFQFFSVQHYLGPSTVHGHLRNECKNDKIMPK